MTHKNLQTEDMILSFPKHRKMMIEMKIWVLEVGDIISDTILTQTTQKTSDTKRKWIPPRNERYPSFLFIFL